MAAHEAWDEMVAAHEASDEKDPLRLREEAEAGVAVPEIGTNLSLGD